MSTVPGPKPFYTINEVSKLSGVEQHTLRYWETEFKQLDPEKNSAGQRIYRQKHLDLVLRIAELLYKEKYTTEGARSRLERDLGLVREGQITLGLNLREAELTSAAVKVKRQVKALLDDLAREPEGEEEPAVAAPEAAPGSGNVVTVVSNGTNWFLVNFH